MSVVDLRTLFGESLTRLGIGTTWMGFPWPPGKESEYISPSIADVCPAAKLKITFFLFLMLDPE